MALPTVTLEVRRSSGGKHTEKWVQSPNTHCPSCGDRRVWVEMKHPYADLGSKHICSRCGTVFYLPDLHSAGGHPVDLQALDAVRDTEEKEVGTYELENVSEHKEMSVLELRRIEKANDIWPEERVTRMVFYACGHTYSFPPGQMGLETCPGCGSFWTTIRRVSVSRGEEE